jgi:hypothetical protein
MSLLSGGVNTDMSVIKGMLLIKFLDVGNLSTISTISNIDFPEL